MPQSDRVEHSADAVVRDAVLLADRVRAEPLEEMLDADLAVVGDEGAGRVDQGDDERVVQPRPDPLQPPSDRPGAQAQRAGDHVAGCAGFEGHVDERAVGLREQRRAAEEFRRDADGDLAGGFRTGVEEPILV